MGYKDGIENHLAGRRREREIKDLNSIMVNRFMLDIDIKTNTVTVTKEKNMITEIRISKYTNTRTKLHEPEQHQC